MRKVILFVLLFMAIGYSQIPLFYSGSRPTDGQSCAVQTFSTTDTSFTATYYWYPDYSVFTGAASLFGGFDLISGADTVCTIKVKLIMRKKSELTGDGATVVYDSTDYHTLSSGSGNWIPAEDGVTSTYTPFSVDLAAETWWKPNIGIEVQFIQNAMASGTKELEAYVIPIKYAY